MGSKDKNPRKKILEQSRKVQKEPNIERCLKEDISGKVREEPDTENV